MSTSSISNGFAESRTMGKIPQTHPKVPRETIPLVLNAMMAGNGESVKAEINGLARRMEVQDTPIHKGLTAQKLFKWLSTNPYTDFPMMQELSVDDFGDLFQQITRSPINVEPGELQPKPSPELRDYKTQMAIVGIHPIGVSFDELPEGERPVPKHPTQRQIPLKEMTNQEIFEMAISPIQGSVFHFGNWQRGGKCPDIQLTASMPLKRMYKREERMQLLKEWIEFSREAGFELKVPENILELGAVELIENLAEQINAMNISQKFKEDKLADLIQGIVVVLVGRIEGPLADLFHFTGNIPLAREYVYYGDTIPSAGQLFLPYDSESENKSKIRLDAFIQQGGADCRGANTLFAVLLNAGFPKINSTIEARLLYAKHVMNDTTETFNKTKTADHNMVLLRMPKEVYKLADARWSNNNNIPLRAMIEGVVDNMGLYNQMSGAVKFVHAPEREFVSLGSTR